MPEKHYEKVITDALPEILRRSALLIETRAKQLAPVDLGIMRSSITTVVEEDHVFVKVLAPHALYMEYGRPPGNMPPIEAIAPWARRHNLDPFLVARSIGKKGIPVGTIEQPLKTHGNTYRPFLRPAAYQMIPQIRKAILDEIEKQINKMKV